MTTPTRLPRSNLLNPTAVIEQELDRGREGAFPRLTYVDLVHRAAEIWPQRDALVIDDTRVTFAELAVRVEEFTTHLGHAGVVSGDKVGVLGTNSAEWLAAVLAITNRGAIAVPLNGRDSISGLAYTLLASDASYLLYASRVARRDMRDLPAQLAGHGWLGASLPLAVRNALQDVAGEMSAADVGAPEDVGIILFTSGSTARPKGCMLTQQGMIRNALLHTERLGIAQDDRWFSPMPFFHAGGLVWGITSMLVSGSTLVSQPKFDAATAINLIERERCTYHHGIDAMFVAEMNHERFHPDRVSTVRIVNSTGSPQFLRRIREEMGIEGVVSKWGTSEGYGNLTLCAPTDPLDKRLDTVGRGYRGIDYRIVDPSTGQVLAPGESGEIQVRGSNMVGYYRDPDATRALIEPDGWLHSWDQGFFDIAGYLHYQGRIKEMLKVGGENVSIAEVESVLMSHTGVQLAVVVAAPHPKLAEVPVAFVVPRPGAIGLKEALLDEFARDRLADFKVPVRYVICGIDQIPTTGSGKVARRELQQQVIELVGSTDARPRMGHHPA
jgi:fatty-acyl-CoA synthase